ncbi:MAG TPA: tetrahydrofolate dehydrogenase/cyclohydrolase catalytic domain-containing protein, partial [Isosphaeraceae bacterium]|nr:tetrahydrofolate dehydrogenase/cyclohydrolase catalytic domain-containing protein [Isosphaeraceae bacterium]
MTARILDGKALALSIRAEAAREVAALAAEAQVVPGLTVVLVGENPASQVYVRSKQNACKAAGMRGEVLKLAADVSEAALLDTIDSLNANRAVHGILVQLPLPKHIDERRVVARVRPDKD